jgi:hypothetical protein
MSRAPRPNVFCVVLQRGNDVGEAPGADDPSFASVARSAAESSVATRVGHNVDHGPAERDDSPCRGAR